ncbi:MAG: hypothetical protein P8189_13115 [Anaerolineae bacterium]
MIVIEDQDDLVGEVGYVVDQRGEDGLGRWWLGGLQCAQHTLPYVGLNGPQGSDKVG